MTHILLLLLILVLCLAYSITTRVHESFDNTNHFEVMYDMFNLNALNNKGITIQLINDVSNNPAYVKIANDYLQKEIVLFTNSRIYSTYLDTSSDFYISDGAFDGWMNLVSTHVLSDFNKIMIIAILGKIITVLGKIKSQI